MYPVVVDHLWTNLVAYRAFDFGAKEVAAVADHHVETPNFEDAFLVADPHQQATAYVVKDVATGIAFVKMAVNCCYYSDYLGRV